LREDHLVYCGCVVYHLAHHKRKISLAPINSLPGKNCLVAAIRRLHRASLSRAQTTKPKSASGNGNLPSQLASIFGGKTIATHDLCASRGVKNFPG
jgi:hypothetical protein